MRLNGQSYHRVLPADRERGEECGLSYYIYDDLYREARDEHRRIPTALIDGLRDYLMRKNRLVSGIRCLGLGGATSDERQLRVVLKVDVGTDEMASFSIEGSGPGGDRREIVFYRQNDDDPTFVSVKHPLCDALQFVLLAAASGWQAWVVPRQADKRCASDAGPAHAGGAHAGRWRPAGALCPRVCPSLVIAAD